MTRTEWYFKIDVDTETGKVELSEWSSDMIIKRTPSQPKTPEPKPEPKPAPQKSNGSNGRNGLDKKVESLCHGLGHRGNASLRTKLGRVREELGIRTVGDLLSTDRDVVKCVHLFGPGSIARLEVALAKRGLEWD